MGNVADLVITVAYFSIPVQIVVSLLKYPRLARMPARLVVLSVLFALFIFLCGAGHLLRYLDRIETASFAAINGMTAAVSLLTALYLLPLVPSVMASLDGSLDLLRLNGEIEESRQKLFTFMAFLCHEIRNPLFAITSSTSFLGDDTDLNSEQCVCVEAISDASLLMLRIVNDVLDLSKIDSGKLELEYRDFDLHRLLQNLGHNMTIHVDRRTGSAVALKCVVDSDVPRVVHGDSVRILQIVYNLLSNASKFTDEGRIELRVSVCRDRDDDTEAAGDHHQAEHVGSSVQECSAINEANNGDAEEKKEPKFSLRSMLSGGGSSLITPNHGDIEEGHTGSYRSLNGSGNTSISTSSGSGTTRRKAVTLSIEVSDTGIGIAPDRIGPIFEPYAQSKLSDFRKHGGSGLGLSILSSLIDFMGGSIGVTSVLGEGSTFKVLLPVHEARQAAVGGGDDAEEAPLECEEDCIDMSDPLLSCRRLPVYEKEEVSLGAAPKYRRPSTSSDLEGGNTLLGTCSEENVKSSSQSSRDKLLNCSLTSLGEPGSFLGKGEITNTKTLASHLPPPQQGPRSRTRGRRGSDDSCNSQSSRDKLLNLSLTSLEQPESFLGILPAKGDDETLSTTTTPASFQRPLSPPSQGGARESRTTWGRRGSDDSVSRAGRQLARGSTGDRTNNKKASTLLPKFDFPPGEGVVLVVDDNGINRKFIGKMLSFYGIEYRAAANGLEAIEAVRASRNIQHPAEADDDAPLFGLVFMDLSMPVCDGYEAIAELRRMEREKAKADADTTGGANASDVCCSPLPIVALTANALSQERARALKVGASEFHTKPILRADMHKLCAQFLLRKSTSNGRPGRRGGCGGQAAALALAVETGHHHHEPRVQDFCYDGPPCSNGDRHTKLEIM